MTPAEIRKFALEKAVELNSEMTADYIVRFAAVLAAYIQDGTVPAPVEETEDEVE